MAMSSRTRFHGSGARKPYAPSIPSLPSNARSPTQLYSPGTRISNYEEHDASALCGRFPSTMYTMLEDEAMVPYVRWYQKGDLHGLYIPDISVFVLIVLPSYFPDIKKWGSFQKQLNNYGFEKQDRSAVQAIYTHWDNKFQRGRRDLLSEVVGKRARGSIRQDTTQWQAPPSSPLEAVEVASQPASQYDLHNRIGFLEDENRNLKHANSELTKTVAGMQSRFQAMENRLEELSRRVAELSVGSGFFNSTVHPGSTVAMLGGHFQTSQPSNSSGMHTVFSPRAQGGPSNVDGSHGAPPHPVMGMYSDTIDPSILVNRPSHPQPGNFGTSGNPGLSPPYANGQPTFGTPCPPNFSLHRSPQQQYNFATIYPASSSHRQRETAGVATGTPSLSHNASGVVLTGQAAPRVLSSDSTGSSGKRSSFGGMFPVPPPPNPSSSRF